MTALLKRYALALIIGLGVLLALAALVAFLRGQGAARASEEAARARGGQAVARAGETASQAAVEAVAIQGEKEAVVADADQENREEILTQPDAGADAGATGDAGLRGLCRRPAYRDHPRCVGLRQPGAAATSR